MKNFTSITILLISALTFSSCSGNAGNKDAPKATNPIVTSNTVIPPGNTQVMANTTANKVGKDSDDIRGKDADDARKSNSNVKAKDKDDLKKKGDADDKGKRDNDSDDN